MRVFNTHLSRGIYYLTPPLVNVMHHSQRPYISESSVKKVFDVEYLYLNKSILHELCDDYYILYSVDCPSYIFYYDNKDELLVCEGLEGRNTLLSRSVIEDLRIFLGWDSYQVCNQWYQYSDEIHLTLLGYLDVVGWSRDPESLKVTRR